MFSKCNWRLLVLSYVLLLSLTAVGASAQQFSFWGDLEKGPYDVGFETIERYDYSRAYRSSTDYFGQPQEGETARPIQILIWYPAQPAAESTPMVYGEYAFPYPNDDEFFNLISTLQNRELQTVGFVFGGSAGAMQAAMDLSVTAVRDAPHQEGSFPLIVYHSGLRSGFCQNATMCEYLASHGFIVATTHALGVNSVNATAEPRDIETLLRDREFVVAQLHDYPYWERGVLGVMGFSTSAVGALIHRMRNNEVDAVACLGGPYLQGDNASLLTESPYYDPVTMTVPLLQLYTAGETTDMSVLDSLTYAPRHLVSFSNPSPAAFTHYTVMSTLVPDTTGDTTAPDPKTLRRDYEATCRYVEHFFTGYLTDDSTALAQLSAVAGDNVAAEFRAGRPVPPTADQFIEIVRNYPVERVMELSEQFGLSDPAHPILSGPQFTAIGYSFLQRGQIDPALVFFEMGVEAYPNSANAWDSYGEVCAANGQLQKAVECYKKALEILPNDEGINPALRDAIASNAPGIIERLQRRIAEENSGEG